MAVVMLRVPDDYCQGWISPEEQDWCEDEEDRLVVKKSIKVVIDISHRKAT